ncbi:MAG: dehydrogenase [Candidatus Eremiobacteraeota bacterium]|nr:dehydrogenase [Candidatus Eremiobacteraeota bacterium]
MKTRHGIDLNALLARAGEKIAQAVRHNAGLLPNVRSKRTQKLKSRVTGAKAVPSLCCYCAVGCSTLAYVSDEGTLLDVEGNPDSPINGGHLCPKGAGLFGLTINSQRWTTMKYRAPYSDHWEEKPLEWAMERIAHLVKETREKTFVRERDGKRVNHTLGIASLGGATFALEENYLLGKLMHSLGVVSIENQARI